MKKRLFRNLLMLGLLLITLTAAVSAATFNGLFYKEADPSSNIDWDKAPAEQINMTATFYCNTCRSNTTVIDPASPKITLTGYLDIQISDLIPRIELSRDCLAAVHKSLGFSLLSVYCPQITSR